MRAHPKKNIKTENIHSKILKQLLMQQQHDIMLIRELV